MLEFPYAYLSGVRVAPGRHESDPATHVLREMNCVPAARCRTDMNIVTANKSVELS